MVCKSNSLGPIFIQKFVVCFVFFGGGAFFLFTHQWEVVQQGGIPPMLLPKSICVCIPCFKSVAPKVWSIFEPDMNTEMGVVIYMYLKHSPDYIDFKFI